MVRDRIGQLNHVVLSCRGGLFTGIKRRRAEKKLNYLISNFDQIVEKPLRAYRSKLEENNKLINYLTYNQNYEIKRRSKLLIKESEYIVSELNDLSPLIWGSIGELKAIELLRKLPDRYFIINNLRKSFNPPLFHRSENEKVFFTQIDHIVIGLTGIYAVETKYWSQKSIESNDLASPIKQIKKNGFALYCMCMVNDLSKESRLFSSNWETLELSVSKILLMMNSATDRKYQHVKILTERDCVNYITSRPVILKDEQIRYIVNNLT